MGGQVVCHLLFPKTKMYFETRVSLSAPKELTGKLYPWRSCDDRKKMTYFINLNVFTMLLMIVFYKATSSSEDVNCQSTLRVCGLYFSLTAILFVSCPFIGFKIFNQRDTLPWFVQDLIDCIAHTMGLSQMDIISTIISEMCFQKCHQIITYSPSLPLWSGSCAAAIN